MALSARLLWRASAAVLRGPCAAHARALSAAVKVVKPTLRTSDPAVQLAQLSSSKRVVAYRDHCEGDDGGIAVLALHGMPGSSNDFRYLAPYAEDARVRFLRLDSPGHGATPLGDTAPTVEATALFAKEAATQLLGPSRKYVAVGHSQGGPVAIKLAHLDDNCVGVALLCPVTHRPHRGIRPWWIQQFFTRLSESSALGRSISVAVMGPPYKALGFFKVSPDELILAVRRVGYLDFPQLKEDASTLPKPNALFFSHDDQLIEPAVFAEFSDLLPAGDRFPFETGGHNIQKFQAEKCAQGILALVSRLQCAEKVATDDAAFEDRRPRRDFEKLA